MDDAGIRLQSIKHGPWRQLEMRTQRNKDFKYIFSLLIRIIKIQTINIK